MAIKTKKPSGMVITRNGMKFTCTWKIADANYDQLHFQWRTNLHKSGQWVKVWHSPGATTRTITLNAASYYPNTSKLLKSITIRIAGRRKAETKKDSKTNKTTKTVYTVSDWTVCTFTLDFPSVPGLSAALDDELSNVTKFTWNETVSDTNRRHFTNVEWQSIRVKESNVTDGSKLKWNKKTDGWLTGTGSRSSSYTITEDTVILAKNSYTRWFRVRARGARGASAWRYAKHVYAIPYVPTINSAKKEGTLTWINMTWTANASASHPIDKTTVEWTIATPLSGRKCPSGASWTEAAVSRDTKGKDSAKFLVDASVGADQCLWVRVAVEHDRNWRATGARLVISGALTAPTDLSVETNDSTHRATITATNNSEVPDSRLAVVYRAKGAKDVVVGIIPHGSNTVTVQCPNWSGKTVSFGVYAFQGSATGKSAGGGVTTYAVTANMKSSALWKGGAVPVAPGNVTAVLSDDSVGEVVLTWSWSWSSANRAELSWSQNPNAWESTDEPETYMLSNLNAAKWRVSGLETGVTWYFRIRLAQVTGDETTFGPYCDAVAVDTSSAPSIPVLILSKAVVTQDDTLTASWAYSTTDGTAQSYAELCEAAIFGESITYGRVIAHATTAQHMTISPANWEVGSVHYLCVRVTSGSGHISDGWSDPVAVTVAEPIECAISQVSLTEITIGEGDDERTVTALTAMPLTAEITGAGNGGTTTLIIERAQEYHMDRPDGSTADGYEGETIVLYRQDGESQISIGTDDLIGLLDDGALYRLIATVEDELGQTASAEREFEVHWTHQAGIPDVEVEMVDGVTKITPVAPENIAEGDVCDIYRLTADLPELIVENGAFGTAYVDPYPAIGAEFGHRIVHRTVNGDYITADNHPAWVDTSDSYDDMLDEYSIIVDFDGNHLVLPYDISLSNRWTKDFQKTDYLGGAQQGDWNPAVTRTGTYTCNLIADENAETIWGLRELADYSGACHIRTPEGSSFAADVQVAEAKSYDNWDTVSFTLTVTRIDPEELDGMLYSEWVDS